MTMTSMLSFRNSWEVAAKMMDVVTSGGALFSTWYGSDASSDTNDLRKNQYMFTSMVMHDYNGSIKKLGSQLFVILNGCIFELCADSTNFVSSRLYNRFRMGS